MSSAGIFRNSAAALLLAVPAFVVQDRAPRSLAESLDATVATLARLAGLESRATRGDAAVVPEILGLTEPALDPARQPDALLSALQEEVSHLESALDAALAQPAPAGADPTSVPAPGALTTGLDDAGRRDLAREAASLSPLAQRDPAPVEVAARPSPTTFEEPGYAADALRLARLLYRQARFQEALDLLEGREDTPAPRYWRARCLEKLGRLPEAERLYQSVVEDPAGGEEAQRARADLEFLRWRIEFAGRSERVRSQAAAGGGPR